MNKFVFVFVAVLVLSTIPVMGETQQPVAIGEAQNGIVCITRMKDAVEPGHASLRRITISSRDPFGEQRQLTVGQAYKSFPEGRRMVLTVLEPEEAKRMTYLYRDDQPNVWIYLPATKRVIEQKSIQTYQSFMGTDFTLSDIGLVSIPKICNLAEMTQLSGVKAYKVEENIPGGLFYSRIVTWVATDSFLPLQREYYDEVGALWKRLLFKNITTIGKIPTPLSIEMKDVQKGSSTELKITRASYDVKVPDEFFDAKQFSKVTDSPLWKTSPVAK